MICRLSIHIQFHFIFYLFFSVMLQHLSACWCGRSRKLMFLKNGSRLLLLVLEGRLYQYTVECNNIPLWRSDRQFRSCFKDLVEFHSDLSPVLHFPFWCLTLFQRGMKAGTKHHSRTTQPQISCVYIWNYTDIYTSFLLFIGLVKKYPNKSCYMFNFINLWTLASTVQMYMFLCNMVFFCLGTV